MYIPKMMATWFAVYMLSVSANSIGLVPQSISDLERRKIHLDPEEIVLCTSKKVELFNKKKKKKKKKKNGINLRNLSKASSKEAFMSFIYNS